MSRLKELLDYFTYMDGKVASCLVASLLPLIKISRDILVCDTSMFLFGKYCAFVVLIMQERFFMKFCLKIIPKKGEMRHKYGSRSKGP